MSRSSNSTCLIVFGDFTIDSYGLSLCQNGINYCPKTQFRLGSTLQSCANISRKLRLSDFHNSRKKSSNNEVSDTNALPIISCTNRQADIVSSNNAILESNIQEMIHLLLSSRPANYYHHNKEENYLRNLSIRMKASNYTICKSDKGANYLFMSQVAYDNLVLTHLRDQTTYEEVSNPLEEDVHEGIVQLCTAYKTSLLTVEFNYLCNSEWNFSRFYILPKIHKSHLIQNAPLNTTGYIHLPNVPNDLSNRPIISNINSVTSKLSHFIDAVLKPYTQLIPSYVRDTKDFLSKLPKEICGSSIYATGYYQPLHQYS